MTQCADTSDVMAHDWAGGAFTAADARLKVAALRRHCEGVGRRYGFVLRSYFSLQVIVRETHA